jgi:hypothetical protein
MGLIWTISQDKTRVFSSGLGARAKVRVHGTLHTNWLVFEFFLPCSAAPFLGAIDMGSVNPMSRLHSAYHLVADFR